MPKATTSTLALTQHRLISLGYVRLVGLEVGIGNVKWDMGGIIAKPEFRRDGAPKLVIPSGIWDIEMESVWGIRMAVQCTSRDALSKRVAKAEANQAYWNYEGIVEFWGWETNPQSDGGYRLRIVDPKTSRDDVITFYPETIQPGLMRVEETE